MPAALCASRANAPAAALPAPDVPLTERTPRLDSVDAVQEAMERCAYVADRDLATCVFLAMKLDRPLFLEGETGVGKTEIAKVLSSILDAEMIRLQCYEGLDVSTAVYEWNYARQILRIRMLEAAGEAHAGADIFTREFLLARPLLQAIDPAVTRRRVLLVDELDRADEEFEAFLLEALSDFQVTVPEIGTFKASEPPVVVITSNRTREVHDALKRRCLYHWIDFPDLDKELRIVRRRVPEAAAALSAQVVAFVQELRSRELYKRPGVAETLDWLHALRALSERELAADVVERTLGVLLKYQDDVQSVRPAVPGLIEQARASA